MMSAPLLGALFQAQKYVTSYKQPLYSFNQPTTYQIMMNYRNYSLFTKKPPVPSPSEQMREFNKAFNYYLVYGGPKPSPTIIVPQKTWAQRFYEYLYGTPESKVNTNLFPLTKQSPTFEPYINKKKDRSWWE